MNQKLKKMEKQIDRLINNQLNDDDDDNKQLTEEEKVRLWMENDVKLSQYTDILIDNGYDEMECIVDITMNELEDIGIDKIGHRKKIFKYSQKLKRNNMNNNNIKGEIDEEFEGNHGVNINIGDTAQYF